MMNRRGQLAFLMMFVVAIVLVVASLFAFVTFGTEFGDISADVSQTIYRTQFGEDYCREVMKDSIKGSLAFDGEISFFEREVLSRDIALDEAGNCFKQIRENAFALDPIGDGYKLEINGLFSQGIAGKNEIKRNYDLCMEFDNEGNYLRDCVVVSS